MRWKSLLVVVVDEVVVVVVVCSLNSFLELMTTFKLRLPYILWTGAVSTPVQYTCLVHLSSTPVQYTCPVHLFSTPV